MKGRPKLDKVKTELMEERLKEVLAFTYPIIMKANMANKFHVLDYLPILESKDSDEIFDSRGYEEGPRIGNRGLCQVLKMQDPTGSKPDICLKKIDYLSPEGKVEILTRVESVRKLSSHTSINKILCIIYEDDVIRYT